MTVGLPASQTSSIERATVQRAPAPPRRWLVVTYAAVRRTGVPVGVRPVASYCGAYWQTRAA
jgi:hypothetical protein